MMATGFRCNDIVYIPFWIVSEYLGATNPDRPLLQSKIVGVNLKSYIPNGAIEVADIEMENGIVAHDVPVSYLILPQDVSSWAKKISDWFLTMAD